MVSKNRYKSKISKMILKANIFELYVNKMLPLAAGLATSATEPYVPLSDMLSAKEQRCPPLL